MEITMDKRTTILWSFIVQVTLFTTYELIENVIAIDQP